eukprot:scaffold795_cov195-Alexandrium_tamarense.AAC.16
MYTNASGSSSRKRSPFTDADPNVNRKASATGANGKVASGAVRSSTSNENAHSQHQQQQRAAAAGPISSILQKSRSSSAPRSGHTRPPPPPPLGPPPPSSIHNSARHRRHFQTSGSSNGDINARARLYKAEAYEAKITIASQEQRIDALQKELEEVKLFADLESNEIPTIGNGGAANGAGGGPADANLIEALAQELESTERDLKVAHERMGKLEHELVVERSKNASGGGSNFNEAAASVATKTASEAFEKRELELKKQIESQKKELEKNKSDASEGVAIMRELEKALRSARVERDNARLEREQAVLDVASVRAEMEQVKSGRCQSPDEQKMAESLKEAQDREAKLQNDLQSLVKRYEEQQSQSQEMESVLSNLSEKFEEQKVELTIKTKALEEMEDMYASNLASLREDHKEDTKHQLNTLDEQCRQQYEQQLAEKEKEFEHAMSALKIHHESEIKVQDDLLRPIADLNEELSRVQTKVTALEAIETNYMSEIKTLKATIQQLEQSSNNDEEFVADLRNENIKLRSEKAELARKIERGVVMYNERTHELHDLESRYTNANEKLASIREEYDQRLALKETEVKQLQSQLASASKGSPNAKGKTDADLIVANKTLRRDLTQAVESSISRAREIQSLEKEIEAYHNKLTRANQKVKQLEKNSASAVTNTPVSSSGAPFDEEKQRLDSEISSLRTKAWEADKTINGLKQEMSRLSAKVSHTDMLENELLNARNALVESQTQISNLQEALGETEVALRAVSRLRSSPRKSPGKESANEDLDKENEEMRTQIENDALKHYFGERLGLQK